MSFWKNLFKLCRNNAKRNRASPKENSHDEVELLWLAEAEKRFQEIQQGTAQCRPAEEVLREARARLK